MAKFAPVAPPRTLMSLKEHDLLGNYHLILAHDVYAQQAEYQAVFKDINPSSFIILDNSLIELGNPAPLRMIEVAATTVKVSCVVLPDYMKEQDKTIDATKEAVEKWKDLGLEYMICPQGRNFQEITDCLIEQMAIVGGRVRCIGVGRYMTHDSVLGSRLPMIRYIHGRWPRMMIHLLGFSDHFFDDMACAQLPYVAGIDSAVPIRYGLQGKAIQNLLAGADPGPRGNYWKDANHINSAVAFNIQSVRRMIAAVRDV